MTVRRAGLDDVPALEDLYRAFFAELPPRQHDSVDLDQELSEIRAIVTAEHAFLAESADGPLGFALARRRSPQLAELTDLYVLPEARAGGIATALVRELVSSLDGAEFLNLVMQSTNATARTVYQRWGFHDDLVVMVAPLEHLRERLAPGHHAVSFASVHVQTDDLGWVERTVTEFARRIRSPGSRVEGPRNGWTAVYDPVADGDPNALLRLSRELSERLGAVVIAVSLEVDQVVRVIALDRGGIVDEYLSVPEFYGPLPPGDVIGLAANPTVLARLTGAEPAAVKAVARTAPAPAELPPPRELLAAIAAVLGLEGTGYGFEQEEGR
jgi:ribosomal protein S18 acetylase RimI-like enzyme